MFTLPPASPGTIFADGNRLVLIPTGQEVTDGEHRQHRRPATAAPRRERRSR